MPDDLLDLRLRTATALGFRLTGTEPRAFGGREERYEQPGGRVAYVYYDGDGNRRHGPMLMPNWPHDLGACAEVLAAIEARGWEWEAAFGGAADPSHRAWFHLMRRDENNERVWLAEPFAPTLPEAICKAFCEACEGEAVREAADNA